MDDSRLMRAVVTVVTVLVCVWILSQLKPKPEIKSLENKTPQPTESEQVIYEELPPVEVTKLPLVAMDNTCEYSRELDISGCTGVISGSAARIYELNLQTDQTIHVTVEPSSDFFDPSFAIISENHTCVGGSDIHGPGLAEKIEYLELLSGNYSLIVSGYDGDCGPYSLTVTASVLPIAQITAPDFKPGPNGTVVTWKTFAEFDLSHFILYRKDGDNLEKIAVLRKHGSPAQTANYRFVDRQLHVPDAYEIEAVATDGRTEKLRT